MTDIIRKDLQTLQLTSLLSGKKCMNFGVDSFPGATYIHPKELHRHDYYQIIMLTKGSVIHTIDFVTHTIEAPAAAVVFPQQIHKCQFSANAEGRTVLFDKTVFCSEILANELKEYNLDIHKRLNAISFNEKQKEFQSLLSIEQNIRELYTELNPIRIMQIKFMMKILLLKLIDQAPTYHSPSGADKDIHYYSQFRSLIDTHYAHERKLEFYTARLGVTSKKLNALCQLYSGISPLGLIQERLSLEIKKCFLYEDITLKEMAFRFGFSSQSALNKYINTKFSMTPSDFKEYTLLLATGKQ
ncbi:MAG: helix-turn-helix transcriptional regulator [Bacteroidales bacterium]